MRLKFHDQPVQPSRCQSMSMTITSSGKPCCLYSSTIALNSSVVNFQVPRKPDAERIAARHRRGTADRDKRLQRAFEIVAIAKKIPVRAGVLGPGFDPIAREELRARVVEEEPAITRQQALPEIDRTCDFIERRDRAAEVPGISRTRRPLDELLALANHRPEVRGIQWLPVRRINEPDARGFDHDSRRRFLQSEIGRASLAVNRRRATSRR